MASIATCRTPGCRANGQPIEVELVSQPDGDEPPVTASAVYCGECSTPITDVTDAPASADSNEQESQR